MKQRTPLMICLLMAASSLLAVRQQEFISPNDVRKKTKLKKFGTIMYSDEKIFNQTGSRTKEYVETSGFRVQLASSQTLKDVLDVKEKADSMFDTPVYIDFESPNYKLRIGNFLSNTDALNFQENLRKKGFRDAWVVPSKIVVPKQR